jgi:hypothetical protein
VQPVHEAPPHAPNTTYILLTLTCEGVADNPLVQDALAAVIRKAMREVGLAAFVLKKTFVPGGRGIHVLLSRGGQIDQVERRTLRAVRAIYQGAGELDREILERWIWLHPVSPISACISVGEASITSRLAEGQLYTQADALCGTGPFSTWRLETAIYSTIHDNGPFAIAELSVFRKVEAEGVWCYETRVGPRRVTGRQRLSFSRLDQPRGHDVNHHQPGLARIG